MKLSTFANPMVTPSEPFVDRQGVLVPLTAYKLIQSLWNRTGAGDGIVPSIATGLTAAGNSQLTALALTDDWNEVDTVAGGTGVQIPQLSPGQMIAVFNGGANALAIYPFG